MSLDTQLKTALRQAQNDRDFPDFLAVHVEEVIDHMDKYLPRSADHIELLIEQIDLYETYAQTGYLGRGMTAGNVKETLKLILGPDRFSQ
ncbi:GSU3529 family protein [Desulfurispira natronophila]|uniref:Uncharacterized protein n=1 Tax=Desulfurispira natronophila TaxID=682562 RepID=A0A7W7Y3V0_9BACT|nr:hypothetical protein [Desulfurispira natronophila]MBB5021580.1 hypothetical protein [Desulfurispira natronophila]